MTTKTRYQKLTEERLGMPLEQFVLNYRRQIARREVSRAEVARNTGIPKDTLINWEERFLVVEEVVQLRELPTTDNR
jgi:DNA-binding transcriptional regulator YiaG